MVLKRAKCDFNGVIKSLFLPKNCKNHPAAGGCAPSVTRLNCKGLFSTGPKLDHFCAKKHLLLVQAPLSKTLVALLIAITSADRFFKPLYGPHTKRANERCRAYMCLFFKDEYKMVALKYQFLCAKNQSIL